MTPAIEASHLRKFYGRVAAVRDVSLAVEPGEIFGIVGPNGAGKTTTVECLEGQRRADGGTLRVLGLDPQKDSRQLLERIGVQLQETNLPDRLRVWEALDLFASFYRKFVPPDQLLDALGLAEKRDAAFANLSGGQKQRLFIALALVNDPELVFLDELTTGLDPQARHSIWDLVLDIKRQGKTVVLTTHFMEEAERLCDRVAVMDRGEIIALDTPQNLIKGLGTGSRVVFEVEGEFDAAALAGVASRTERDGDRVTVHGDADGLLGATVRALEAQGCKFRDLRVERPNLEDVFLALTGRQVRG